MSSDASAPTSLESLVRAAAEAAVVAAHTALPGIVEEFDAATQLATVQVGVRRHFRDADGVLRTVSAPKLVDVPVVFPRAGGFALTFPVAAGDGCLLVFAERDIGGWYEQGDIQDPPTRRHHDLSDAIAIVGLYAKPDRLSSYSDTDLELRSDDGATVIRIEPSGAVTVESAGNLAVQSGGTLALESANAISVTRGADELLDIVSQLASVLETLSVNTTTGVIQPAVAALIAAQRARVDAMKA